MCIRDSAILDREPAPARAELGNASLRQVLFDLCERTNVGGDLLLQFAGQLVAATVLLHPLPEMAVVIMLSGIIEEGLVLTERALHNLLDRLVFPLRTFGKVVGGGHIGLVVLVVMDFERFARHVRGKRVVWIGKLG